MRNEKSTFVAASKRGCISASPYLNNTIATIVMTKIHFDTTVDHTDNRKPEDSNDGAIALDGNRQRQSIGTFQHGLFLDSDSGDGTAVTYGHDDDTIRERENRRR